MVHFLILLQLNVAVVTSEIQGKSLGWAFLPKSNRTDSPWDATCPAVSPFLPLDMDPVLTDSHTATLRRKTIQGQQGRERKSPGSLVPLYLYHHQLDVVLLVDAISFSHI